MKRPRSEPIEQIRRRFRRRQEWLLIAIDKMDESTTTPLRGRLLAHSPDRDEIHRVSMRRRPKRAMVVYSNEKLPPNTVVVFRIDIDAKDSAPIHRPDHCSR